MLVFHGLIVQELEEGVEAFLSKTCAKCVSATQMHTTRQRFQLDLKLALIKRIQLALQLALIERFQLALWAKTTICPHPN